jgi:3D (Asp-Asp-Asp) domain-containing protein
MLGPRQLVWAFLTAAALGQPDRPALTPPAQPLSPPPPSQAQPLRLRLTMTAYTSRVQETDATPFITATGRRVRWGTVAASRDLLAAGLPYGTKLRVVALEPDPRRCGGGTLPEVLVVEDTLHPRKRRQLDVWMDDLAAARRFGRCAAVVEVLRGPEAAGDPGAAVP